MHFSRYAARVIMLVRGPNLSRGMSDYLVNQIEATPNIEVRFNASVTEACGENNVEAIAISDSQTGETERVAATSLFIFIGAVPRTDWLQGVIETDERGFLLSGSDLVRDGIRPKSWNFDRDPALLETNLPGVFVAGDVRAGSIKRVASSASHQRGRRFGLRVVDSPVSARSRNLRIIFARNFDIFRTGRAQCCKRAIPLIHEL